MSDEGQLSALIHGRVQGVYFRMFVYHYAIERSLVGYARNLPDERTVEVRAEGEKAVLEELLSLLKQGPPGAKVEKVDVNWSEITGEFTGFEVR